MNERDKINEAVKECAKLLAAEGVEVLLVAAVKDKSAYRISNLPDNKAAKEFVEYIFGLDESGTLVESKVYHRADTGEFSLLGGGSDELN